MRYFVPFPKLNQGVAMYRIIVWHNDSVNGTHQATLFKGAKLGRVLFDFDQYLKNAPARSFNAHNLIQLHHIERGVVASFPASLRG